MLYMPPDTPQVATIVGLDPGSFNLGVAVLQFDLVTYEIVSTQAWTLDGVKLARQFPWITQMYGDLEGRIYAMADALSRTLAYFQPLLVASEAPFISKKFPQAGLVLTRVVAAIRRCVMQFDFWKTLDIVDPPTVKMMVGAPGNAPKEVIKEKVLLLPGLNYIGTVPLDQLDEHSIDALAVAYGRYRKLLEDLCLTSPNSKSK
jgi:Holliday junction resolvasome RuvABC endonuclease subunit